MCCGDDRDSAGWLESCRTCTASRPSSLAQRDRLAYRYNILPVEIPVLDEDEPLRAAVGQRASPLISPREVRVRLDGEYLHVDGKPVAIHATTYRFATEERINDCEKRCKRVPAECVQMGTLKPPEPAEQIPACSPRRTV